MRVARETFIEKHPVGNWCQVPDKSPAPFLKFGRLDIPAEVDNRFYCTAIEDQGAKPWCAAYTAAAFAENVMWRRDGRITQVEPEPLYKWAKLHDGDPTGDGTTLNCALDALCALNVFDGKICKVRMVGRGICALDEQDIRSAVHRFGCFLAGFNITEEWYDLSKQGVETVVGKSGAKSMGGHAVLVCGYDEDGVWIENSWGDKWGSRGFGFIRWAAVRKQFMYGAVLTHCLDGFK